MITVKHYKSDPDVTVEQLYREVIVKYKLADRVWSGEKQEYELEKTSFIWLIYGEYAFTKYNHGSARSLSSLGIHPVSDVNPDGGINAVWKIGHPHHILLDVGSKTRSKQYEDDPNKLPLDIWYDGIFLDTWQGNGSSKRVMYAGKHKIIPFKPGTHSRDYDGEPVSNRLWSYHGRNEDCLLYTSRAHET